MNDYDVQKDGLLIQFIPEKERTHTLCLQALQQNGLALQFVQIKNCWFYDTDIQYCWTAVEQNVNAFQFVPSELRSVKLCTFVSKSTNIHSFFDIIYKRVPNPTYIVINDLGLVFKTGHEGRTTCVGSFMNALT